MPRKSSSQAESSPWRSRIVGHGEEDPTQLLANPLNWRTHPMRQRMMMRGSLKEVGWVQQVIVNTTTGHVVDGHLRVEEAISANAPKVPVLYVELSPEEERVVLATLDPLGAMAGQSEERLLELVRDLTVDDESLGRLLASMAKAHVETYTDKAPVLLYEPTGEKPEPAVLHDETKASALRSAIEADPDMDDGTRAFLLSAAGRHTVFDYAQVAEFYAHAPANIQRHMERSALVIIDVDDAIAEGYVRFAQAMDSLSEEADEEASDVA